MIEPAPAAELFLHKACSARLLGERYGWNNFGSGALFEAMDKTDAEHRSIAEAPGVAAQEVALAMLHSAPCLERFPIVGSSESEYGGEVIIVANPGEDPRTACLQALLFSAKILQEEGTGATLEVKNWSQHLKCGFYTNGRGGNDPNNNEEDTSDHAEMLTLTKIMAERLNHHFEFGFDDDVVVAPMIYGGYSSDGSIVGVLTSRVWT